jgi:hypothetical protein
MRLSRAFQPLAETKNTTIALRRLRRMMVKNIEEDLSVAPGLDCHMQNSVDMRTSTITPRKGA